jgi:MFS family permease
MIVQVAVYYLPGTLVGSLIGGWLGDKYGRITTIGAACIWSICTAALQSAAQNSNMMFCGTSAKLKSYVSRTNIPE